MSDSKRNKDERKKDDRAHEVVPPISSRHRWRLKHPSSTLEALIIAVRPLLRWWRSSEVLRVGVGGRSRRRGRGSCLTESFLNLSVCESFGGEEVESDEGKGLSELQYERRGVDESMYLVVREEEAT